MLRRMPSDWRSQYNEGRYLLRSVGGPALPATPTPEEAMEIIGITAGGNRDTDRPTGRNKVPASVRAEALKGLRLSYENNYGAWTFIGIARAIQLVLAPGVSDRTMERMERYFGRHAKDRGSSGFGDDSDPSRGYMAWLNWGGDAGLEWVSGAKMNPFRSAIFNPKGRRNPSDVERALAGDKNLAGALLQGADLQGVNLSGVNLEGAYLQEANLEGADLRNARMKGALLTRASLHKADLSGAVLRKSVLKWADFSQAVLEGADLQEADLQAADLQGANLDGSSFIEAKLESAYLSGVRAKQANFEKADCSRTNFEDADLTGAKFEKAKLIGANFNGANVARAKGLPAPRKPITTPSSPSFRKWLGRSVLTDGFGEPLVFYHGTDNGGFTVFDLSKIDKHHPGFFVTDNASLAKTYTSFDQFDPFGEEVEIKKGVYRLFVKMENPFVYDAKGARWDTIPWGTGRATTSEIGQWAKDRGYDGTVIQNVVDPAIQLSENEGGFSRPTTVYIVFDPRNIKSAAYNRGTWDLNDPDIRHNPRRARRGRSR